MVVIIDTDQKLILFDSQGDVKEALQIIYSLEDWEDYSFQLTEVQRNQDNSFNHYDLTPRGEA